MQLLCGSMPLRAGQLFFQCKSSIFLPKNQELNLQEFMNEDYTKTKLKIMSELSEETAKELIAALTRLSDILKPPPLPAVATERERRMASQIEFKANQRRKEMLKLAKEIHSRVGYATEDDIARWKSAPEEVKELVFKLEAKDEKKRQRHVANLRKIREAKIAAGDLPKQKK